MNSEKQKLLIEYLISSPEVFAICSPIVDPNYFDPEFRNAIQFVQSYYQKLAALPDPDQISAESQIKLEKREISKDKFKYCMQEVEEFCQRAAMENAVMASVPLIEEGDYGQVQTLIRNAATTGLAKNLGLEYFNNPKQRLTTLADGTVVFPTGWTEFDSLLLGGIARKELILWAANSGVGKSMTLANLAFNMTNMGLNCLYITLELSEEIVAQRFDTMFTGIGRATWKHHISEIATKVEAAGDQEGMGNLHITYMRSGSNANHIRAYLREFELLYGYVPDLLVVDYLDKVWPVEKVSADNIFEKDRLATMQLREVGVDYNMFVASASQLNRTAVNATHHDHSQIAGGISKINESDIYVSIVMNPAMRAAGEMIWNIQKTRNSDGDGSQVLLAWRAERLRILDPDGAETSKGLTLNTRVSTDNVEDEVSNESGLMGLMRI